jgi:hypothetical protein
MYMKAMIAILIITTSSISCAQRTTELVYDTRVILQCEDDTNISPSQSAKILSDGGIDVIATSCGIKTGMLVIAMCGAPSLSIIVHEIQTENLQEAAMLGFSNVNNLVDSAQGLGYELSDCEAD